MWWSPMVLRPGDQRGLALLEVLVAFVIAAAAVGVVFSGVLDGMRGAGRAARMQEGLSHARSHLAAIGHGQAMRAGETSGDDGGGFSYRLSVVPIAAIPPEGTVRLYAVRIVIGWTEAGQAREVSMVTQRVDAVRSGGPGGGGP